MRRNVDAAQTSLNGPLETTPPDLVGYPKFSAHTHYKSGQPH